ncbi:MAG: hypothetical protein CL900_05590 [Dehalococcoidia bacterium]|nr:hypothetical protein [Dehalococcoidia bacterium]
MNIDIHSHVIPTQFWNASDKGQSWFGAKLVEKDGNSYVDTMNRFAGPIEPNWRLSMDDRLNLMDSINVDMQVVSTPPYFFNYHLDPDEGAQSARSVNEDLMDYVAHDPNRFQALANVPLQNVDKAVSELRWAIKQGFKGAEICTNVNGTNYDDQSLWPFFKVAEELDAFLFFHPHAPAGADRMKNFYLANTIGNPLENTVAIASIVFGGLLDECPDLKLCFAHGGGYACFGMPRMDRGFKVRSEARENITSLPSEYLSKIYYDCLTHGPEELEYLVNRVGFDRVLLGSDFPFDMGLDSPPEWISQMPFLDNASKEAILGGNAKRLLKI